MQKKASKNQLQDKVNRLKNKYKNNVVKRSAFSRPHNLSACSSKQYSSLVLYGGSAADLEDWFRQNPELVSKEQRHEMLIKSHSMKIARAEQQLNEITLMDEQVNLMADAVKASQE